MSRLAAEHIENMSETGSLLSANEFVRTVTQAMKSIAQLYADALKDLRLDADMLIGLLYVGSGAVRGELEPALGLAIYNSAEMLQRLISAGFISEHDNEVLRPTSEAQAIFHKLSHLAQRENRQWRDQLQDVPGGNLVLDDFLMMLRTSNLS